MLFDAVTWKDIQPSKIPKVVDFRGYKWMERRNRIRADIVVTYCRNGEAMITRPFLRPALLEAARKL